MNVEQPKQVTPYAGVWIEIRETLEHEESEVVTPYAGVWIEISTILYLYLRSNSHSLRGSVD